MFIFKYKLLLSIVIIKSYADKIVSEEKHEQNYRNDKNTYSKVQRRFFDELDDETWHISHLKDTDFSARRSNCAEDTFEEKLKRYRKSLQNDGALVEYVSADALPFNETDLINDVCKVPDKKDAFRIALQGQKSHDLQQDDTTKPNKSEAREVNSLKNDATFSTVGTDNQEKLNIATTTTEKMKKHIEKPLKARKASEYQFSSIEYYDETFDFNSKMLCPDDVEEIILEIDNIRTYDVRCEQILEWRSLE